MGKIQTYQGGQVKANGLADVPRGSYANADAFGAARYRDVRAFAQAVGNAGATVTEIAKVKQERIDRTTVRDAMTTLSNQYRDWEKTTLKERRGMAAADLDKEGEVWFQERRREIEATLKTRRQKDLFGPQFDAQAEGAKQALFRYSVQQVEAGEKLSRDVQNENFIEDSAARGLMDDARVAQNRALMHTNIEANFRGHHPDVIAAAKKKGDAALYSAMVEGHAARSLENALEYLKRDDVKEAFTTAAHRALVEKLTLAKNKKDTDEKDGAAALDAIEQRAAGK
ncbi:MAG: hypothetical protein LIP77_07770, partial [Planctomycetes bacterium]|nr:hypothetical protein [Planctomycetota bacterium]